MAEWQDRSFSEKVLVTTEGEIVARILRCAGTWSYKTREFISEEAAKAAVEKERQHVG